LPQRLTCQYNRLSAYEQEKGVSFVCCYGSGERLYENGYRFLLEAIGSQEPVPHGPQVADRLLYFGGPKDWFFGSGTPTCSMMARTETFKSVGGFDADLRRQEDTDLAIRLALQGAHFIGCPEKIFLQHATESADKTQQIKRDAAIRLVEKHKDYLKSVGMYRYARTWVDVRYYNFTKQYGAMACTLAGLSLYHPLRVAQHLWQTGPARLKHERRMAS
jgi:hypothetical protein